MFPNSLEMLELSFAVFSESKKADITSGNFSKGICKVGRGWRQATGRGIVMQYKVESGHMYVAARNKASRFM